MLKTETLEKNSGTADILILIGTACSFFVLGMFGAFKNINGNGLFGGSYWTNVIYSALLGWIIFELLVRLYYFFVSLSIFVFVVPKKRVFYCIRAFLIARNLIVSGISFLLFVSPIFINYLQAITFIIDFVAFLGFFAYLTSKYFKTILAPFAWNAFLRPFLVFEPLLIAFGGII